MKESTRNEIIRLHYGGASQRRIAKLLGVARKSVARALVGHEKHRAEPMEVERAQRPSVLDPFADHIAQLLERWLNQTEQAFLTIAQGNAPKEPTVKILEDKEMEPFFVKGESDEP